MNVPVIIAIVLTLLACGSFAMTFFVKDRDRELTWAIGATLLTILLIGYVGGMIAISKL